MRLLPHSTVTKSVSKVLHKREVGHTQQGNICDGVSYMQIRELWQCWFTLRKPGFNFHMLWHSFDNDSMFKSKNLENQMHFVFENLLH